MSVVERDPLDSDECADDYDSGEEESSFDESKSPPRSGGNEHYTERFYDAAMEWHVSCVRARDCARWDAVLGAMRHACAHLIVRVPRFFLRRINGWKQLNKPASTWAGAP